MDTLIEFRNMSFGYDTMNAFNDFNMEIETGDIVTLIGPSGSGKSTLLKMLCNKLPNGSIYFNGQNIKSYSLDVLRKSLVVVFDEDLKNEKAIDELKMYLLKLNLSHNEIDDRIEEFKKHFGLFGLDEKKISDLTYYEKSLFKILRFLIIKPAFIAIDNIFSYLKESDKKKIISYIKSNHMTLLNVSTDLNDSLYGNKLFVLENFVLILEGPTLSILKTDTILKRLGFSLPLAVDLSIELGHYDILEKIYVDNKKLVNELWK